MSFDLSLIRCLFDCAQEELGMAEYLIRTMPVTGEDLARAQGWSMAARASLDRFETEIAKQIGSRP